ncbi:hypothetical protein TS65_25460 [Aneurinibacillus migulanus]|uniref:Uncharacterized protein n=1 Tax=Aneurinibacillus migulanus TaxID=47500 RepID=A0A0D1XC06_ANEMI|nr:hypothetical protein TS65_25460 [Aneurinibacillus migulanus]KON98032.1 hypothetical protein AF333_23935 [Aneurinibacillus migulanus]
MKKKRVDAPCAPAEDRPACLFPTAPAHRPSFFSSLSPQEFADVSNQIYKYESYPLFCKVNKTLLIFSEINM